VAKASIYNEYIETTLSKEELMGRMHNLLSTEIPDIKPNFIVMN